MTHSEMVLDVAAALVRGLQLGVELTEDVLQGLAADVCQHVQTTSGKIKRYHLLSMARRNVIAINYLSVP